MRIPWGRGWLAVVAVAARSADAFNVTFTDGDFLGTDPNQAISFIYDGVPRVFHWNSTANIIVNAIYLETSKDNDPEIILVSQTRTPTTQQGQPPKNGRRGDGDARGSGSSAGGGPRTGELTLDLTSTGLGGSVSLRVTGTAKDEVVTVPLFFKAVWANGVSYSRRFTFIVDNSQYQAQLDSGLYSDSAPRFNETVTPASKDPNSNGIGTEPSTVSSGGTVTSTPAVGKDPSTASGSGSGGGGGGGLSSGAVIGIAVACGVVGLILVFALVWFLVRRRQQQNPVLPVDSPYVSGNRTDELMAEKEAAAADADVAPHSPYSDEGGPAAGPSGGAYQDGTTTTTHGEAVAAAAVAAHRASPQDQPQSFTPYSDRASPAGTGAAGTPVVRPASLAQTTEDGRVSVPSPTPGRATPRALSTPYAHLVEDGMTEDEIRRLEEEERQLDAAIEQAGRR